MMTRSDTLARLRAHPERSVLVIGGGVNGAAVFRDLALQGLDVLLVEKNDFCSGASAASSHMAHGGIRYLENGEFRLVREAVRERNRLLENAPHYVRPLPTTIPIFKIFSGLLNAPLKFLRLQDRPAERGALVIKIGLLLYDAYTGAARSVPRHVFSGRSEALARLPQLNPDIRAAATYYDGAILNPERLCLELILDAEAQNPQAHALNYCPVVGLEDGRVVLTDQVGGEKYMVAPRVVVNAAGPWIDFTNQAIGTPSRMIGGTRGSHLVLDHPELRAAIGEQELFFENDDGRIVLIFPFFDRVLVGTSDLRSENPDEAVCTEAEIDYFLEMVGRVFPEIEVAREAIIFTFSGVRPLPSQDATSTGQISRDHSIETLAAAKERPFPVHALVGGKWTTFRAFAEQVADRVLADLGEARRTSTEALPIGGGEGYPSGENERARWVAETAARAGISPERTSTLLDRYGTRAAAVAEFIGAGEDRPLASHTDWSRREIEYLARNEHTIHLDDLLLRRTLLAMLGRLDRRLVTELAEILAGPHSWTPEEQAGEIERALEILRTKHLVDLG